MVLGEMVKIIIDFHPAESDGPVIGVDNLGVVEAWVEHVRLVDAAEDQLGSLVPVLISIPREIKRKNLIIDNTLFF